MKTFKNFVTEIKSTIPDTAWDWTEKSVNGFKAHWYAEDVELIFEKSGGITPGDKFFEVWSADFTRDGEWKNTGGGKSSQIFAWVIERSIEFMKSGPAIVRYTANKGESSRVKFYDTMTKIITRKMKGYTWIKLDDSAHKGKFGEPYFIVRDDILKYPDLQDELIRYNNNFA